MPDDPQVLRIGEWRVDPDVDELSRGGQTIRLEPRTMRLLLYLAAHAGRVVDLQQLLDEVWPNVVVTHSSVYQAVAELRRILGDDREHPCYIENLPRRGYRLIAPVAPWSGADIAARSDVTQAATGSSQVTSGPIPAGLQPVSAGPDEASKTANEAVAAPPPLPVGRSRRSAVLGGITVVAVIVAGLGVGLFWTSHLAHRGGTSSPASEVIVQPPHSIAVLPFADMSEKHDQEYFADGLSEEILNLLARIPNLKVIGRTSSFQFKGRNDDLRSIGERLGAAYVLEGSVRRAGDRVRVTAQLLNTRDGVQLWSNTYSRPFGDVLELQDEIAGGVARALEIAVRSDTGEARGSSNSEAYDLYLRGLQSLEKNDWEGLEHGANYFQQALDLDPKFAEAATQLGRMQVLEADFGLAPVATTYERARRNLETAIRLDPSSGVAHSWLGWIYMAYDWNWATANTEMQEALRLAPRDPVVQLCAARLAMALGHWDEAIRLLTSATTRDPLFPDLYHNLAETYLRVDRLTEAEAAERHVLDINPTYASAPAVLSKILLAEGRAADALEVITARQQDTSQRPEMLAIIYHALGREADADVQLATLTRRYHDEEAAEIASVLAFRGHADEAFRWLDRAYSQRDPWLYFIKVDPNFKNIEADPRYRALLRQMNLPE